MPARIMRESEDVDDPMDGSITELSDSEDEDYRSVRDEHESHASEGESNHEESDDGESDDDFEGVFHRHSGHGSWLTVHMMQYRLPWRNVVSWRKLRHQSPL